MLHHQHRPVAGRAPDEVGDAADVLHRHARHRLVQEQQARLQRQGGGEFQGALAPVGQVGGAAFLLPGEAHLVEQVAGAGVEAAQHALRPPEREVAAAPALQRDPDVLQHGQFG